jgi:hypothetical protein
MALKTIENRNKMPLLSEDPAKGQWLHQEVQSDGIMTICQSIVEGITPKRLMAFGYEIDLYFPRIAENITMKKVSEDGGTVTHHQRMVTPFFLSNRSVFPTTYHKHSNDVNGVYTLIRSS